MEYFPEIQKSNEGFLNLIAKVKREARDMHFRSQRPEGWGHKDAAWG